MLQVVLVHPQIPPNTGNVARLCAATRSRLELVEPIGFEITDRTLKRAGLDYWPYLDWRRHADLEAFLASTRQDRLLFYSTKAPQPYHHAPYQPDSALVFGSETEGLPGSLHEQFPHRFYRIPQFHPNVRSLNLSSAVAVVVYEALRQAGRLDEACPPGQESLP